MRTGGVITGKFELGTEASTSAVGTHQRRSRSNGPRWRRHSASWFDHLVEFVRCGKDHRGAIARHPGRRDRGRAFFPEGLPRVQGDRVQLQQVLLNLIINAPALLGEERNPPTAVDRARLISSQRS